METKFKWAPGDVVAIRNNPESTQYYIILGITEIKEERRFPSYIGKKFGISKSGKFTGYHTKAFQKRWQNHFSGTLLFEGMQSLWEVDEIDPEKLTSSKKAAYKAAAANIDYDYDTYHRAQIVFIFKESKRRK